MCKEIQHENSQKESQVSNSLGEPNHHPRKVAWEDVEKGRVYSNQMTNDNGSYDINLFYYGRGSPEEWLVCKG